MPGSYSVLQSLPACRIIIPLQGEVYFLSEFVISSGQFIEAPGNGPCPPENAGAATISWPAERIKTGDSVHIPLFTWGAGFH